MIRFVKLGLAVLLLGLFAGPAPLRAVEPAAAIIAHRGASHDAPENTLAAVRLAWDQGADAVELDVFLSQDGRIVCCHDRNLKRTTGVDRAIDALPLAELQKLDAGRWKAARFAGEKLPLLSEALATLPPHKRFFIEVKCGPEIVPELKRVVVAAGHPSSATAVISFSSDVCAAAKAALPEHRVYWIVGLSRNQESGRWNHSAESLIATATRIRADGLNLSAADLIDAGFAQKVRDARLELYVWTVDDPQVARRMLAAGVQGITTNRPGWLRAQLARPQ